VLLKPFDLLDLCARKALIGSQRFAGGKGALDALGRVRHKAKRHYNLKHWLAPVSLSVVNWKMRAS
jgi:hypothetical protein